MNGLNKMMRAFMAFVMRKLNNDETLGQKLKALRKCANVTLSELEHTTKIQKSILKAFEDGNYEHLPDINYAKNYLKIFAKSLGADPEYYLKLLDDETRAFCISRSQHLPLIRARASEFLVASRFLKAFFILSCLGIVTYYFVSQLQTLLSPPQLTIYEPFDGQTTSSALLPIKGQTEPGTQIFINHLPVLLDQNGYFETKIPLVTGLNIIDIEGSKRYSRITQEERRVVLEPTKEITYKNTHP